MITHTVQAKNAIKWIDSLKGGKKGYKKGTYMLGSSEVDDNGYPEKYCCLGVACRTLDLKVANWGDGSDKRLVKKLGLNDANGEFVDHKTTFLKSLNKQTYITGINDITFAKDTTFTNIRKFILKNLDYIFIPDVAKKLKEHYNRK